MTEIRNQLRGDRQGARVQAQLEERSDGLGSARGQAPVEGLLDNRDDGLLKLLLVRDPDLYRQVRGQDRDGLLELLSGLEGPLADTALVGDQGPFSSGLRPLRWALGVLLTESAV